MRIVKVPTSLGSLGKNKGCEKAPDIIIKKLREFYLNEFGKKANFDVDEVILDKNNLDKINEAIRKKEGDIFIGGDHSITYSCFNGLNTEDKALLIFDAHPDLEVSTKSITHEDYLRKLIEDKILSPNNIILVGLRSWSENELKFLNKNKIKYFDMKKIFELDVKEVCDIIMENVNSFENLYLSIDIDVVDPAFAPGTSNKNSEPGGLTSRQLIYFIQRLKLLKNLKRVDIVEVNPELDVNDMTSKLVAKLIMELI